MSSEHDHAHPGELGDCCDNRGNGDCCDDRGHGGCCDDRGCHANVHDHAHLEAATFDAEAFGGVDLTGDGGLYKKVLTPGDADAGTPSGKVRVHYVGTLLDGSKFDSSRDRSGFFEFDLGVGRVIKGWDVGIASMSKGEKAILACRSDYAYGDRGSPPKIPPKATLLFEARTSAPQALEAHPYPHPHHIAHPPAPQVELFSWKPKRKDKWELDGPARMAEAEALKAEGTKHFKAARLDEALDAYTDAASYIDTPDYTPPDGQHDAHKALLLSCLLNGATCALKLEQHNEVVALTLPHSLTLKTPYLGTTPTVTTAAAQHAAPASPEPELWPWPQH